MYMKSVGWDKLGCIWINPKSHQKYNGDQVNTRYVIDREAEVSTTNANIVLESWGHPTSYDFPCLYNMIFPNTKCITSYLMDYKMD